MYYVSILVLHIIINYVFLKAVLNGKTFYICLTTE